MANHKQALKRHRQSEVRRDTNRQRRSTMKTAVRKAEEALAGKSKDVSAEVGVAIQVLARAQAKGLVHRNTAARKISRLAKTLHAKAAK